MIVWPHTHITLWLVHCSGLCEVQHPVCRPKKFSTLSANHAARAWRRAQRHTTRPRVALPTPQARQCVQAVAQDTTGRKHIQWALGRRQGRRSACAQRAAMHAHTVSRAPAAGVRQQHARCAGAQSHRSFASSTGRPKSLCAHASSLRQQHNATLPALLSPQAASGKAAATTHSAPTRSRPAAAAAASSGASATATTAAPHVQRQAALTVRRLILLRHADSESSAQLRDYDRPISQQGRREAAAVAKQLCDLGWVPDLIIASNSRRTKQTLDTMAEAAAELSHVDAHFLGSLYTVAALDGQTKHHLEETIRSVASDAAHFCVMCVGHNKGWEEAASAFAQQAVRLSTASGALLEAVGPSWEDVTGREAQWKLVKVVAP